MAFGITDLAIWHGTRRLLRVSSFHVRPGERVGIIGPTGSGKTMLALTACGLLADAPGLPQLTVTGAVHFSVAGQDTPLTLDAAGKDEAAWLSQRGKLLAYMAQEAQTALHPLKTIMHQLRTIDNMQRRQHGLLGLLGLRGLLRTNPELDARLRPLCEELGLPWAALSRLPHEISGGQAQRALLLLCILRAPQVLVADEPVSALDSERRRTILDAIARHFPTALVISHDRDALAGFATRVVTVQDGEIIDDADVRTTTSAKPRPFASATPPIMDTTQQGQGLWMQGVTICHPNRTAPIPVVRALDLHCVNSVIWVIGGSGSGKSSLARVMLGVDQPHAAAAIQLNARPIGFGAPRDPGIRAILQDPYTALNVKMPVWKVISEPVGFDRAKAAAYAELVGLPENALDRYPAALSGGQRQRTMCARAMICTNPPALRHDAPQLIVADEPFSALDPASKLRLRDVLLAEQARLGCAMVIITHDLPLIPAGARVLHLEEESAKTENGFQWTKNESVAL